MNIFTCTGNLTQDPVLRTTPDSKSVCTFALAVNRKYKSANGNRPTDFFDVVVWGKRGQTLANMLKKGMRVFVRGEMQSYSYTGKNGVVYVKHQVVLDDDFDAFEFLSAKKQEPAGHPDDEYSFPEDTGGEA